MPVNMVKGTPKVSLVKVLPGADQPGITSDAHGTVSIDMQNAHARRFVQLVTLKRALSIEVNTGLKMSRGQSPLAIAQAMGVTTKKTKKGALADVEAEIETMKQQKAEAMAQAAAAAREATRPLN